MNELKHFWNDLVDMITSLPAPILITLVACVLIIFLVLIIRKNDQV